jgi:hypothetical protein
MGVPSELVRQAQELGISIIPPATSRFDDDEGFDISLTDAQRQAAADVMPRHRDIFKPQTKGRKRISLPVERWEELSRLVERKLMVEQGHGRTRLRNLRKEVDSALSDFEMYRQLAGSTKREASKETSTSTIYRMRIDLRGAKPPIWRRIEVPDCTLAGLHVAVTGCDGLD